MGMTPEEYAARELRVPGYDKEEPVYAPGSDPNIELVMNGGAKPEPAAPEPDPVIAAMALEYNFTLPLDLRRAELVTEVKKQEQLDARTGFWNALSTLIMSLVQ